MPLSRFVSSVLRAFGVDISLISTRWRRLEFSWFSSLIVRISVLTPELPFKASVIRGRLGLSFLNSGLLARIITLPVLSVRVSNENVPRWLRFCNSRLMAA